jgi:hypothetical protein
VSARRTRLVDCNPRWISGRYTGQPGDAVRGVHFDCPEGHAGCSHAIPFTPTLEGGPTTGWQQNGAVWQRTGDTFDTLVLSPSIRRNPTYASMEAALAAGALPQYLEPTHFCAFHGYIGGGGGQTPGLIEFCGDSR